jgi:hypothetical protein
MSHLREGLLELPEFAAALVSTDAILGHPLEHRWLQHAMFGNRFDGHY